MSEASAAAVRSPRASPRASPGSSTPTRPPTPALPPLATAVMRCADDIKWLSWNAAWHAANVLARCDGAASTDLQRFEQHASALTRELPSDLAGHVRSMVWSACWHAANSRGGALRSMAAVMEEEEEEEEEDGGDGEEGDDDVEDEEEERETGHEQAAEEDRSEGEASQTRGDEDTQGGAQGDAADATHSEGNEWHGSRGQSSTVEDVTATAAATAVEKPRQTATNSPSSPEASALIGTASAHAYAIGRDSEQYRAAAAVAAEIFSVRHRNGDTESEAADTSAYGDSDGEYDEDGEEDGDDDDDDGIEPFDDEESEEEASGSFSGQSLPPPHPLQTGNPADFQAFPPSLLQTAAKAASIAASAPSAADDATLTVAPRLPAMGNRGVGSSISSGGSGTLTVKRELSLNQLTEVEAECKRKRSMQNTDEDDGEPFGEVTVAEHEARRDVVSPQLTSGVRKAEKEEEQEQEQPEAAEEEDGRGEGDEKGDEEDGGAEDEEGWEEAEEGDGNDDGGDDGGEGEEDEGEEEEEGEKEEEEEGEEEEEDEEAAGDADDEGEGEELEEGTEAEAEEAAVEARRFEQHAAEVARLLPRGIAQHLKYLAWSAGWAAVHARSGHERHAALQKELFEKHAAALAAGGTTPKFGVNLGGWLLCEGWMQVTLFEGAVLAAGRAEGSDGDGGDGEAPFPADEYRLCQYITREAMAEHRSGWITAADLEQIKRLGLTSVRLPIGYWVLDLGGRRGDGGPPLARKPAAPYTGNRAWIGSAKEYIGPAEEIVDHCLQLCRKVGLSVNLCLHGAPGGQSGEQACGFTDPDWEVGMWDVDGTVRCVEHMARRWGRHVAVDAITVINEPSDEIPLPQLLAFYERAYAAVRKHSSVGVVLPVYKRDFDGFAQAGFPPQHMNHIALDCHLYQCFGDGWQHETTLEKALECARSGEGHWPCLPHLPSPAMVSEWSLRLPTWDARFPVAKDLAALEGGDAALQEVYRQFGRAQIRQFGEHGAGWYFWTWKVDAGVRGGGDGEPHWDMRECVKRGWLDPLWWGSDLASDAPLLADDEIHMVVASQPVPAPSADAPVDVAEGVEIVRCASVGHADGLADLVSAMSLTTDHRLHRPPCSLRVSASDEAPHERSSDRAATRPQSRASALPSPLPPPTLRREPPPHLLLASLPEADERGRRHGAERAELTLVQQREVEPEPKEAEQTPA